LTILQTRHVTPLHHDIYIHKLLYDEMTPKRIWRFLSWSPWTFSVKKTIHLNNKQLLDEAFENNQDRGRAYQPKPKADNPYQISQKLNLIIVLLYTEWIKNMEVMLLLLHWPQVTCTKRANLTQLLLEICTVVIHDMITRDLECPWHDYCIICS